MTTGTQNSHFLNELLNRTVDGAKGEVASTVDHSNDTKTLSREKNLASTVLAESSRRKPEARITMTIHLPQTLAAKIDNVAKKGGLSRNELVKLILEKATS